MTTQQMEYFLSLAQKLNFSAVAERFFISQPTLSRQISNMERELNAQLFIRKNNTVYLTRAGEQLYAGLKNIYGNFQDLARQVEDLGRSRAGQLHIGVAEEQQISGQLLAAVRKLHQERPDVQITIRRCLYDQLRNGLLDGDLDLINGLGVAVTNQTAALALDPNIRMLPIIDGPAYPKVVAYRTLEQNPLMKDFVKLIHTA